MVKMAFNVLDRDKSGEVDIEDIKGVFNGSCHPDVVAGKRTEQQVLVEFIKSFESGQKENERDGVVTLKEFEVLLLVGIFCFVSSSLTGLLCKYKCIDRF
jgi:Ca2+-binding EF-hand superfamily protein